jgi:hypothetical protein
MEEKIILKKTKPIDIKMESKIVGRPKKYTTEEARLRKLEQTKESKKRKFKCDICDKEVLIYAKENHLKSKRHMDKVQKADLHNLNKVQLIELLEAKYTPKVEPKVKVEPKIEYTNFRILEKAFKGYDKTYSINLISNHPDPFKYLDDNKTSMSDIISIELKNNNNIKVYGTIQIQFIKNANDGVKVESQPYFNSNVETVLHNGNIENASNKMIRKMANMIQAYQREGSNWQFNRVVGLYANTSKYKPLKGSSYIDLLEK